MSYIKVTFSGKHDIADALMTELVTQDIFPTINSGVVEMSQYLETGDLHKYEITFQTGDGSRLQSELSVYLEKNYPSITTESILNVPAPTPVETGAPSAVSVEPGNGVNG